ncbi:hypothetical protein ACJ5H2_17760 [Nocardioides sp. R1-1]|uniref:hypothetical protein n=1 Tax=Nocardioides sp. R1-1 TaxID=3383502 RepID=UPI0038D16E19
MRLRPLPLLVPLIASFLTLTGCGNAVTARVVGAVGVGTDPDGTVVAVVATCGHDLDTVTLVRGREGLPDDEPNPVVASGPLATDAGGLTVVTLTVASAASPPGPLRLDDLTGSTRYVLSAHSSREDVEAEQVTFAAEDLSALPADRVVTGDGQIRARDALREACTAAP